MKFLVNKSGARYPINSDNSSAEIKEYFDILDNVDEMYVPFDDETIDAYLNQQEPTVDIIEIAFYLDDKSRLIDAVNASDENTLKKYTNKKDIYIEIYFIYWILYPKSKITLPIPNHIMTDLVFVKTKLWYSHIFKNKDTTSKKSIKTTIIDNPTPDIKTVFDTIKLTQQQFYTYLLHNCEQFNREYISRFLGKRKQLPEDQRATLLGKFHKFMEVQNQYADGKICQHLLRNIDDSEIYINHVYVDIVYRDLCNYHKITFTKGSKQINFEFLPSNLFSDYRISINYGNFIYEKTTVGNTIVVNKNGTTKKYINPTFVEQYLEKYILFNESTIFHENNQRESYHYHHNGRINYISVHENPHSQVIVTDEFLSYEWRNGDTTQWYTNKGAKKRTFSCGIKMDYYDNGQVRKIESDDWYIVYEKSDNKLHFDFVDFDYPVLDTDL